MIYLAALERRAALPPGYPGDTDVLSRFDRLTLDAPVTMLCGDNGCPPFVFAHVPMNWQDDYKGKGRTIADGPNYRWQFVLRWPCEKTGEKWFNEVFVPYFVNRPEVNRFVSSKIYHDVVGCQFHRLVELWFDGPEEWYAAAVEGTRDMPKPEWAEQDQFPFLKPNFNIVSMFLSDMAASDNLTQYRGYLTMR